MAFLWKHPQSKYFIARFFDLTGKRRNRSTRVLAREKNREEAERIAGAYEEAANKRRTGAASARCHCLSGTTASK